MFDRNQPFTNIRRVEPFEPDIGVYKDTTYAADAKRMMSGDYGGTVGRRGFKSRIKMMSKPFVPKQWLLKANTMQQKGDIKRNARVPTDRMKKIKDTDYTLTKDPGRMVMHL